MGAPYPCAFERMRGVSPIHSTCDFFISLQDVRHGFFSFNLDL